MTQEAPSLITDEMKASINREGPPSRSEVDKTGIRMYARSVGHTDPIFYDEDAAKARGYRSLVCPPGYLGTPAFNPARMGAMAAAMGGGGPRTGAGGRPMRVLNGGTEYEFTGTPICAGDVLTSVGKTVEHRAGGEQSGPDADHAPREHLHQPERRSRGPQLRHQPQLLGRRREMADQVFWNDLKEGDEIPRLVKNCSTQQLVQWAAGSGDFYQIHYDETFAKGTGLQGHHRPRRPEERLPGPAPARLGGRRRARSCRYGCSYRGMDYPNQDIICRGVVTKKYEEGGKALVELDIWTETGPGKDNGRPKNAEGIKTTPGTAVVALPKR